MLCGNNNDTLKYISKYNIELVIYINDNKYVIKRVIGDTNIIINEHSYSLETAKEIIKVNRTMLQHLIHSNARDSIILDESTNKYNLFQSAYELLELNEVPKFTEKYYEIHQKIKDLQKRKKELEKNIGNSNHILIDEELKLLTNKIKKISNLNEEEIKKSNVELYNQMKEMNYKKYILINNISDKEYRIKTIDNFINDISFYNDNSLDFIEQANSEIGKILKLNIEPVLEYHKSITNERITILTKEKKDLKKEIKEFNNEVDELNSQISSIDNIVKEKDEVIKIFELQLNLFQRERELQNKNLSIIEYKEIDEKINRFKKSKIELHEKLNDIDISKITDKYIKYTNDLVKKMYPDSYESSFEIKIIPFNKIQKTNFPIEFNFRISKDNSEGVKNTRNLIVDLMIFKFSNKASFMIWDSKTFNGIDPKQLIILLNEIKLICKETQKQAIVGLNSFQLSDEYKNWVKTLDENEKLILTNNDTLLNVNF